MKLKAPAKLNLYLEIIGKRSDGYHELSSEVVFLDFADEISISAADDLIVEGSNFTDEITLKAANLMSLEFGITQGAKITIQKNIPVGGGLGGGSADAAATIILLRDFWEIETTEDKLYEIALKLGADVPACLYHQLTGKNCVHFSGIGEKLKESEEKNLHIVLANPNQHLATKDVFQQLDLSEDRPAKTNHMQKAAIVLVPEIKDVLAALESKNPTLARITGSGATCFGIFENEAKATEAAKKIKDKHPKWFVKATSTNVSRETF